MDRIKVKQTDLKWFTVLLLAICENPITMNILEFMTRDEIRDVAGPPCGRSNCVSIGTITFSTTRGDVAGDWTGL
jgi:hypothetical protein